MDFLGSLGDVGLSLGGTILAFLFVLTIIVFIHEMGHFLAARWCGVAVSTFSIGFGPELAGFNDRHGTRWKLSAIPLGGYVKFLGDENEASVGDRAALAAMTPEERSRTFAGKGVGARAFIVAAGPAANFVLAIVVFALMLFLSGRSMVAPRIDFVAPESPAAVAGLLPGDVVVAIDGRTVEGLADVDRYVALSPGRPLSFTIERDGETFVLCAAHVTEEAGRNLRIRLESGRTLRGTSLGADHVKDVSLIRVDSEGDFPTVEIGRSADLQRGQWVLMLGHPSGLKPERSAPLRLGRVQRVPIPFLSASEESQPVPVSPTTSP